MVAKITVPSSINRALNYNEQKVKESKAECIYAHNFLKDAGELNFYEKRQRFENLISLNNRAATNTLHISLNFACGEQMEKEKLISIAKDYMSKIGFGDQPFLVYGHYDAGHPHVHILTTTIRRNGARISIHNLGKNQSSRARIEIENSYGLQKAESKTQDLPGIVEPLSARRLIYGKAPTKRAITNIVDEVLKRYKFSSLAEFNALLKLYNVVADRGKEGSVIYRQRGLVYRAMDEQGNKIGVPIKASSIYNKPTLSSLEKIFSENRLYKEQSKKRTRGSIDWIMKRRPSSLEHFKNALRAERIHLEIHQNAQGLVYGLTYIDHNNKCVFKGSELGKQYSAKGVSETVCAGNHLVSDQPPKIAVSAKMGGDIDLGKDQALNKYLEQGISAIVMPFEQRDHIAFQFIKRKKKQKPR